MTDDGDATDPIELVIDGRAREVGTFAVARLLPSPRRRLVGPFTFLDHMGPHVIAPGVGFDVPPHPHIGLSTVTYLFAGENVHRDSLGSVQRNVPGDVNLMTAGKGVVHSERADAAWRARGGELHGVQLWLALPVANEDDEPTFEHHPAAALPTVAPAPGVTARVLFGAAYGARSPIVHPSEPVLVEAALDAGARLDAPTDLVERAVFVISGELAIGAHAIAADHVAVLRAGADVALVANVATRVLVFGGPAFTPRLMDWNFVASTAERIDRARAAWTAQTFAKIPGDDREFVPYPELHHHPRTSTT